jgi:hypothetical protein
MQLAGLNFHMHSSQAAMPARESNDGIGAALRGYRSTIEQNNWLWESFEKNTNSIPFLKEHRDWVEQNSWGYGDRAFHYM